MVDVDMRKQASTIRAEQIRLGTAAFLPENASEVRSLYHVRCFRDQQDLRTSMFKNQAGPPVSPDLLISCSPAPLAIPPSYYLRVLYCSIQCSVSHGRRLHQAALVLYPARARGRRSSRARDCPRRAGAERRRGPSLARHALRLARRAARAALDRGARGTPRRRERAQAVLPSDEERTRRPRGRSRAPRTTGPADARARAHGRDAVRSAYRALLRLAPRHLREAHGDEMEELFAERLAAARLCGPLEVAGVWVRAAADLARARRTRVTLTVPIDERTAHMTGSDIRYAWRSLLRQRGATTLVVFMLALGIAANVAVFTLVNGLFLRPFPFPNPDRLVYINTAAPKWNLDVVGINYPDFDRWTKDQKLFEALMTYDFSAFNLSDGSGAARVRGAYITRDFTKVLGLEPLLGRTFTVEEDRPKGPPVVILSAGLWRERFAADPNVVGRTVRIDGKPRTIVGVMPAEASFPGELQLWLPMAGDPAQPWESYSGDAIGRMKPGVTFEQAQADLLRAHQP